MEIESTPVNDGQAVDEGQQAPTATTATPTETGEQAAPATQPVKQPQSREDNAAFAAMRRQAEALQKQLDETVKYAYGEQGITSYADFEARRRAAEFQQQMTADPQKAIEAEYKRLKENDPDFQTLREEGLNAKFAREAVEFGKKYPDAKIADGAALRQFVESDAGMLDLVYGKGLSPSQAYLLLHSDELIAKRETAKEQEVITKLQANASASPGPVGGGVETKLTLTEDQLKHLDPARLRNDPEYYRAATEANRARFKKR